MSSSISINQALDVWSDLSDAYHGCNGYGGDTAEIYAYRLQPGGGHLCKTPEDLYEGAKALVFLCSKFSARYPSTILIDGSSPAEWLKTHGSAFGHRAHVQVKRDSDT